MPDDKIVKAIINKCDFLYGEALLSKEKIMEKYLSFFASKFNPEERSVCFAFHTGSPCFDVVSIVALMIGCFAYDFSSNDKILSKLKPGDMVICERKRYILDEISANSIILKQKVDDETDDEVVIFPYDLYKHKIKPYYGTSTTTGGRGIRKNKTNRDEFISHILEIPIIDVPSTIDFSVVIVAEKILFQEICSHVRIKFKDNKTVDLLDIIPISYYTSSGNQIQIGRNNSKAEPVFKVTSKISTARDLILAKNENKVIGLMITNKYFLNTDSTELEDLLSRRRLKFVFVLAPLNSYSGEWVMEKYESAKIFACTKELMLESKHAIKSANILTENLNLQIFNILNQEIDKIRVDCLWNWDRYKSLKKKIFLLKQSGWDGNDCDNFILLSMALINLFSTSFFSMKFLNETVFLKKINTLVKSPEAIIEELKTITSESGFMKKQCTVIFSELFKMYSALYESSPKQIALYQFLLSHPEERIAVIMPKAYYVDIFNYLFEDEFEKVVCIAANRFDNQDEYDRVIVLGDFIGKRFDVFNCFVSSKISLLLYEFEDKIFSFRKNKAQKTELKLNARMKILKGDEYSNVTKIDDCYDISEQTINEFSELDNLVESLNKDYVQRLISNNSYSDNTNITEVNYYGIFTTGEQIFFSKFYSAVAFDQNNGKIVEKHPEELDDGDILVFTRKNDYTSNIVDQIFNQLIANKRLGSEIQDAKEKASYWKESLREYKELNDLTYRAIANELMKYGSSLQEMTVRQWFIDECHIIGPRDVETMKRIAIITQDQNLLNDPYDYYDACDIVRSCRRRILSLIAKAINLKLCNKQEEHDPVFDVIFDNIDKISEIKELEKVYKLSDPVYLSTGMVNHPISYSEVSL